MKLPKCEDKFVITGTGLPFLDGRVVSGIHVEIWADFSDPDSVLYFMCIDKAYDNNYISSHSVYCWDTLDGLMKRFDRFFTPYQEPEPEAQPVIPGGSSGEGGADGQ